MKLTTIHTGYFKLDGGAMFGVVPKSMWSKLNPPDEHNMCTWAMKALLVQTGQRNILFDTGIGNKQDEKFRSHFSPFGDEHLFGSWRQLGLTERTSPMYSLPIFILTIAAERFGKTRMVPFEPAFPNASYWSNQVHFDWAMSPNEREKASFLKENFVPLKEAGRLKFIPVEQDFEFIPGIRIRFLYGHTEAMMAPIIQTEKGALVYCADLLPSRWHVGMPYVMAYDVRPLLTLEEKKSLLAEAIEKDYLLFFEHDPGVDCGRVSQSENGRINIDKSGNLSDFMS